MSRLWGANLIDKIQCKNKIGNDIHKQLIHMWNALRGGWVPPEYIPEDEYINVRDNKENYPEYYVGYVGFHSTFSAKYFGGYARGFKADGVTPRYLSTEAYNNTMKQLSNIKDVNFVSWDYKDIQIKNAVIYCDPPYQDTTKYSTEAFNYEEFWNWVRKMSQNNIIFVSEYNAPNDFICIWQKETLANFDSNRKNSSNDKKRVEKLFMYKNESKSAS